MPDPDPRQIATEMRRPILLGFLIAALLVLPDALASGADPPIAIAAGIGVGIFVGGGIGLLWAARSAYGLTGIQTSGGDRPPVGWRPTLTHGWSTITFLILGGAVVLFVWNRLPVAVVAMGVALSLWATGVLDLDEALGGFGDPTVIYIAALFVVSEALDATGVTTWVGQRLVAGPAPAIAGGRFRHGDLRRGDGAHQRERRRGRARAGRGGDRDAGPAAHLAAADAAGVRRPCRLPARPHREPGQRARLRRRRRGGRGAIRVLRVRARRDPPPDRHRRDHGDDRRPGAAPSQRRNHGPRTSAPWPRPWRCDYDVEEEQLYSRHEGVAEFVVPPGPALIGQAVFPGMITESGDLVIVAVQRDGQHLEPGEIVLAAGDAVLVRGTWAGAGDPPPDDDDVLVVDEPDQVRRQVVPLGLGAKEAIGVLAAMVVLLAPARCPPPLPRCSRPGRSSCSASSPSTRPSGRCRGRRSCSWVG